MCEVSPSRLRKRRSLHTQGARRDRGVKPDIDDRPHAVAPLVTTGHH
jgi:hypothetical protein